MKGIIALDIDGTASQNDEALTSELTASLKNWQIEGWQVIFITGRSRLWAERRLGNLPFNYFVAPQNGAVLIEYPSGQQSYRHYLSFEVLEKISDLKKDEMVIYLGDAEERVLWHPTSHELKMRTYLINRALFYRENWQEFNFQKNGFPQNFVSLKWFGTKDSMNKWANQLESEFSLHCPAIRDPYDENIWIALATHIRANKGDALQRFRQMKDPDNKGVIIAAGDDYNDLSLLKASDIGIAMKSAPDELKKVAKFVAEEGLVEGLKQAIKMIKKG